MRIKALHHSQLVCEWCLLESWWPTEVVDAAEGALEPWKRELVDCTGRHNVMLRWLLPQILAIVLFVLTVSHVRLLCRSSKAAEIKMYAYRIGGVSQVFDSISRRSGLSLDRWQSTLYFRGNTHVMYYCPLLM